MSRMLGARNEFVLWCWPIVLDWHDYISGVILETLSGISKAIHSNIVLHLYCIYCRIHETHCLGYQMTLKELSSTYEGQRSSSIVSAFLHSTFIKRSSPWNLGVEWRMHCHIFFQLCRSSPPPKLFCPIALIQHKTASKWVSLWNLQKPCSEHNTFWVPSPLDSVNKVRT